MTLRNHDSLDSFTLGNNETSKAPLIKINHENKDQFKDLTGNQHSS